MTDSCGVCVNTFNKTVKKEIKCNHCDYRCCRTCVEKYITSKNDDFAKCMNCSNRWGEIFITENFSKATIARLETHRKNILFEREKAKIPFSQALFNYDTNMNKLKQEELQLHQQYNKYLEERLAIQKEIHINYEKLYEYEHDENIERTISLLRDNKNQLLDTANKVFKLANRFHLQIQRWKTRFEMIDNDTDVKRDLTVLYKCFEQNCHGFIMSDCKCGICSTIVCKKCLIKTDKDHICNKDDIATIELLLSTTKPCPNCAVPIHKINGCQQMWCPSCKTAFNYRTGEIDQGVIHNPHYNEWIRNLKLVDIKNTQNCNRMVDMQHFRTHIQVAFRANRSVSDKFRRTTYLTSKINNLLTNLQTVNEDPLKVNLDLRIQWINNTLGEDKYKNVLYEREKEAKFNEEQRELYSTALLVLNDLQHKVFNIHDPTSDALTELLSEFDNASNEFNNALNNLHKKYKKRSKSYLFSK